MLLATAGREELSVPNAMPCPTGDRSCERCGGEGNGGTVPTRSGAG
jgi:hypothetical protein